MSQPHRRSVSKNPSSSPGTLRRDVAAAREKTKVRARNAAQQLNEIAQCFEGARIDVGFEHDAITQMWKCTVSLIYPPPNVLLSCTASDKNKKSAKKEACRRLLNDL